MIRMMEKCREKLPLLPLHAGDGTNDVLEISGECSYNKRSPGYGMPD
jgi:hypothetical protein